MRVQTILMRAGLVKWLNRPEYIFQPKRFVRRILEHGVRTQGPEVIELPWNVSIEVDSSDAMGRILSHHGIYEMPVVEALFRLVDPCDIVLDAGANIGYMSAVALAAGARKVISFEPHPMLYARLVRNGERWTSDPRLVGRFDARRQAISFENGNAKLFVPRTSFVENQGLASLETSADQDAGQQLEVATTTLDAVIEDLGCSVDVLKIDIEGHERRAFEGAACSLTGKRIRDIIYEDFVGVESDLSRLLASYEYTIFGLGGSVFGPVLLDRPGREVGVVGSCNLIATLDPGRLKERMSSAGYRCLNRAVTRQRS